MKRSLYLVIIGILLLCLCGGIIYWHSTAYKKIGDEVTSEIADTTITVEKLISEDKVVMDTIANDSDYIFFESRIVLTNPFNESDSASIDEVTNVFQTIVEDGSDVNTTVYMFIHDIATNETNLEVHENAFITDDIALDIDSIKIPFAKAFELARQSNFPPSKSKYITLRHGFGRYACNPFYTIGNTELGHLWVDAITGEVTNTDPSMKEK